MIIPAIALGSFFAFLGIKYVLKNRAFSKRSMGSIQFNTPADGQRPMPPAELIVPADDEWVIVEFNGDRYEVAPNYISPVGIGEALELAKKANAQLPSPGLVDAIWKAADMKIEPHPMSHNGSAAGMNSQELVSRHREFIQQQIDAEGNPNYKLLAGSHKDVVQRPSDGKLYLYGWHVAKERAEAFKKLFGLPFLENTVTDVGAKVIQGENPGKHSYDWRDYSQGARLVRKL